MHTLNLIFRQKIIYAALLFSAFGFLMTISTSVSAHNTGEAHQHCDTSSAGGDGSAADTVTTNSDHHCAHRIESLFGTAEADTPLPDGEQPNIRVQDITSSRFLTSNGDAAFYGDVVFRGDDQDPVEFRNRGLKVLDPDADATKFEVDEDGNTDIEGTLDVEGNTDLDGTLDVDGKTNLDALEVSENADFKGRETIIESGKIVLGGDDTGAANDRVTVRKEFFIEGQDFRQDGGTNFNTGAENIEIGDGADGTTNVNGEILNIKTKTTNVGLEDSTATMTINGDELNIKSKEVLVGKEGADTETEIRSETTTIKSDTINIGESGTTENTNIRSTTTRIDSNTVIVGNSAGTTAIQSPTTQINSNSIDLGVVDSAGRTRINGEDLDVNAENIEIGDGNDGTTNVNGENFNVNAENIVIGDDETGRTIINGEDLQVNALHTKIHSETIALGSRNMETVTEVAGKKLRVDTTVTEIHSRTVHVGTVTTTEVKISGNDIQIGHAADGKTDDVTVVGNDLIVDTDQTRINSGNTAINSETVNIGERGVNGGTTYINSDTVEINDGESGTTNVNGENFNVNSETINIGDGNDGTTNVRGRDFIVHAVHETRIESTNTKINSEEIDIGDGNDGQTRINGQDLHINSIRNTFINSETINIGDDEDGSTNVNGQDFYVNAVRNTRINSENIDIGDGNDGTTRINGEDLIVNAVRETRIDSETVNIGDGNDGSTNVRGGDFNVLAVDNTKVNSKNIEIGKIDGTETENTQTVRVDGISIKIGENVLTKDIDIGHVNPGTETITTTNIESDEVHIGKAGDKDSARTEKTTINGGEVILGDEYTTRTTMQGGNVRLLFEGDVATFSRQDNGQAVRVTGVADGSQPFDAVNYRQLEKVNRGVVMSMAMDSIPAITAGKTVAVGMGVGRFNGQNALAIGFSYHHPEGDMTINLKGGHSGDEHSGAVGISWGY